MSCIAPTNHFAFDITDQTGGPVSSTPEPASFVLLGSSPLGIVGAPRRKVYS